MKSYFRYVLPATLIILLFIGVAIAANLQSWTIPTGGTTAIDVTGSFNYSPSVSSGTEQISGGTLSGGTLTVFEPFDGTQYKTVLIHTVSAYAGGSGTANTVVSWPTAFTSTPGTICNTMQPSGSTILTLNAGLTGGTLTLAASTAPGQGGSNGTITLGGP